MRRDFYNNLLAKHGKLYSPSYFDWATCYNIKDISQICLNVFEYLNWKHSDLGERYKVLSSNKSCVIARTTNKHLHRKLRPCISSVLTQLGIHDKYCIATFPLKQSPELESTVVIYSIPDLNPIFTYNLIGGESDAFVGVLNLSRRDALVDKILSAHKLSCLGSISLSSLLRVVDKANRYTIDVKQDGVALHTKNKEFVANYLVSYMKACNRRGIPSSLVTVGKTRYLFQLDKNSNLVTIRVEFV